MNPRTSIDLWMAPLRARAMGATDELIEVELRAAIHEYCVQSRGWRAWLGPLDIQADLGGVVLVPDETFMIVVWVHRAQLRLGTDFVNLMPLTTHPPRQDRGTPQYYSVTDLPGLGLWPIPDVSLPDSLWVDASFALGRSTMSIPPVLERDHYDGILEGALARLLSVPNKPWSDPDAGELLYRKFRRRCMEARALSDQGQAMADRPWRFPRFA